MVGGLSSGVPGKKSPEERKRALHDAIQAQVVAGGRVESQSDFEAVIVHGKPLNNTLHLLVTIFTCLIWGIVWAALAIFGGERRTLITVDEYGNVTVQKLGRR